MIAVTPIPNASPAIAWVRSRLRPNRTKTAIAVRKRITPCRVSRSSTNELAANTTLLATGAGAGTGKTAALTARLAHLIANSQSLAKSDLECDLH